MEQNNIIKNTVDSALSGMKLRYQNKGRLFELIIQNDNAAFRFKIVADDENDLLVVVGFFPVFIPKSSLECMYKYVNELNYKTVAGKFVINPDDGELTFRLATNVDGGAINEELVHVCLFMASTTLTSSFEDIMKAMFGGPQMVFTFGEKEEPDDQGETD